MDFKRVIEELNIQKGDCVASISSFDTLTIDSKHVRKTLNNKYRDQGHQLNIINSYNNSLENDSGKGDHLNTFYSTARLFLAVKETIVSGNKVRLDIK